MKRRSFLHLAAGTAALPTLSRVASAFDYPNRPIRLVVPFPAGGIVDLYGRLFGQWLTERLGQPVVVENRPGAGSNLGTEAVVRSAADGYTLLQLSASNAWNVSLYKNLTFDLLRDVTPIASIYLSPAILVVHPSTNIRSVPELIAYAKANPNKIEMASGGVGSAQHVYGELFKRMAGVEMLHVPYRGGGPALQDLIAGHVPLMFDTFGTAIPYVREGSVRAIAVTSARRSELIPDVPAIAEFLPGYEGVGWQGIAGPAGMLDEVVQRIHSEVNLALSEPKIVARMRDLGAIVFKSETPASFKKYVAEYTNKWATIINGANIKVE
jgi:tripartite-type tricarboxylate transporter receptor subunit TctC